MAPKTKEITPSGDRGRIGRQGEDLAADFLSTRGFSVIARNWHCRFGELDLIVEREGDLRFVEVKTRRGSGFGYPEESVGRTKRERWFRSIHTWLQLHAPHRSAYQADVISILLRRDIPEIAWIEGISLE